MSTKEFSNSFSLTDEIADIVRERILKGEYEIGEKIKENQIASELPRRQTRKNVLSHRLLLDFSDELFDNLEVDVRFEQRQLDLPHGVVDVRLRQYALAAQFLKGIL